MRTAEEWRREFDDQDRYIATAMELESFIGKVQLDAYRHGMLDAAALTRNNPDSNKVDSINRSVLANEIEMACVAKAAFINNANRL